MRKGIPRLTTLDQLAEPFYQLESFALQGTAFTAQVSDAGLEMFATPVPEPASTRAARGWSGRPRRALLAEEGEATRLTLASEFERSAAVS